MKLLEEKLIIVREKPYLLTISKSRRAAMRVLIILGVFYTFWYGILLLNMNLDKGNISGIMIIFWLAPLMLAKELLRSLKVVLSGEKYSFDSDRKIIEKDDKRIAQFNEIERILVRTVRYGDGPDEYNLSLVFNNKKIRIEQSRNLTEILNAAEEIAELINIEIVREK